MPNYTLLEKDYGNPRLITWRAGIVTVNTSLPETLAERRAKAESYLDRFSQYTSYRHGATNPYLKWLKGDPMLALECINRSLNFWHAVSRHQPQMLLRVAAALPDWKDRFLIMRDYMEEDGMVGPGNDPQYVLLEHLIVSRGGRLDVDSEAEELVGQFHRSLTDLTLPDAIGYGAAINHTALDISDYLCHAARALGSDPDRYVRRDIAPNRIIWTHGIALDWMEDETRTREHGYSKSDIVGAFQRAMAFWCEFWDRAFTHLLPCNGS